MKLKNVILKVCAILLVSISAHAQDVEAGLFLGTAQYQGDLSQNQITFSETRPSLGALARYYFGPRIDVKGSLYYGWVAGDDQNYKNSTGAEDFRGSRNLSFWSHVGELSGQVEINILPYISNTKKYRFAPYVFGGVAGYAFDPKTKYGSTTYDLEPLATEANKSYSRFQLAIPYGLGLKYSLGNFWNIGFEIGQRKIFTDYLDDVSKNYPSNLVAMYNSGNSSEVTAALLSVGIDPNTKDSKAVILTKLTELQGKGRGNLNKSDMYLFAGFTITKTLRRFPCSNVQ